MGGVLKEGSKYSLNHKNMADGLDLLHDINDNCIKTAFFDPQYRGVLDYLDFGNEGSNRDKERTALNQMTEETILEFIKELERVITPSGHLFLWIDKFHLTKDYRKWLDGTTFQVVDMVVWDKTYFGMGYRTRRQSEFVVVLQKEPVKVKGCWKGHSIPDVWQERVKKIHAHSKPIKLQCALIESTTEEGDVVLDPASGGWSVFESCMLTNRNFIGSDIEFGTEW